jgi:hypothetical protein
VYGADAREGGARRRRRGVGRYADEPQIKLHILSDDMDPPLQSSFFPISQMDRAVIQLVEGMELYLTSRQTINLRHNFRIRITIDRVPPLLVRGRAAPLGGPAQSKTEREEGGRGNQEDDDDDHDDDGDEGGEPCEAAGRQAPSCVATRAEGKKKKKKKSVLAKVGERMGWTCTTRHALLMPDLTSDQPLADACLLLALVAGMAHAKERRENPVKANIFKKPVTRDWKDVARLNREARKGAAAESLKAQAWRWIRNRDGGQGGREGVRLKAFKTASVDELASCGELSKFPANIFIFSQKANYRLLKQYPPVYDPTLPNIDILAASLPQDDDDDSGDHVSDGTTDEDTGGRRNPPAKDVRHAALITDEKAFMRKRKARLCRYCGKSFSFIHFNTHHCAKAKRCSGCLRIRGALHVDWKDRLNERDLCFSSQHPADAPQAFCKDAPQSPRSPLRSSSSPPLDTSRRRGRAETTTAAWPITSSPEPRGEREKAQVPVPAPVSAAAATAEATTAKEEPADEAITQGSPTLPHERQGSVDRNVERGRHSNVCPQCGIVCRNNECLSFHKRECKRRGLFICPKCSIIARKKDHKCNANKKKQVKCQHCNEWFAPQDSKEGKHDCKLQKPRAPSFYDRICFWDVETTTDSEGRHSANAVGASYEEKGAFGKFSEVTFYDDALQHPADGDFRHEVFYRQYWPANEVLTPRPDKKGRREAVNNLEEERIEEELSSLSPPRAPNPPLRTKEGRDVDRELGGCLFQRRLQVKGRKKRKAKRRKFRKLATSFFDSSASEDNETDDESPEEEEEEEELEEGEDLSLGATSDEDLNLQPWRAGNGSEQDESRGGRSNGRSHDAQKEREERERVERAGDDKALVKFVKFALSPQMKHTTFIAHNSAKFDGILLIEILLKLNVKVETVFDGQKLLCLKVPINDIRFIDSFRYIKSALEKFPSRFPDMTDAAKNVQYSRGDMEEEEEEEGQQGRSQEFYLAKGIFPYKANSAEFYEYEGTIPDISFFVDEFSSEAKKQEAEKFVSAFKKKWNFKKQLHTYLMNDVRMLRNGCLSLIEEFFTFQRELDAAGPLFHPFNPPFFTLPSFVHAVWRYFGMSEASLYLVSNPTNARKSSKEELEWLDYHQSTLPTDAVIQTAASDVRGQAKRGPFYVDGWCPETETVYEFLGCVVHGHNVENHTCPLTRHLREDQKNPFGRVYGDVHREWKERKEQLVKGGHCKRVIHIWECEWKKMKKEKNNDSVKNFLREQKRLGGDTRPLERLNIRQALRGGRVEPYRLVWSRRTNQGRQLAYIDKVRKIGQLKENLPFMSLFFLTEFPLSFCGHRTRIRRWQARHLCRQEGQFKFIFQQRGLF